MTGHQAREGLDWAWTRSQIGTLLHGYEAGLALSSLAVGTDQVFAEEALSQGIAVKGVIPFADYASCFDGDGLRSYRRLLALCTRTVTLERTGTDEEAFLAAGVRVADEADLLVAVWDGKPAVGLGGTADIVDHAIATGRAVIHLDPFTHTVRRVG